MKGHEELFLEAELMGLYENNVPTREAFKELRDEFNKPSFRKKLVEAHGCKCVVCGTTEDVQFHHVLPLACGGNNNIGNIVPMCHVHHMMTHHSGAWSKYKSRTNENMGRKRLVEKIPDYEKVLDDYLMCRIGRCEAQKRLGIVKHASKLSEKVWFREYLKKNGISDYRNNIDILNCRDRTGVHDGVQVGYIVKDGVKTILYYQSPDPATD